MGRTRLRRFSAAPTIRRRGGDTAPSYDSSVRRRTPRVHRDRRGTRTVVEGRASIVWWCHTSSACGLRPGHLSASSVASARLGGVGQPVDREADGRWRLDVCARQIAYLTFSRDAAGLERARRRGGLPTGRQVRRRRRPQEVDRRSHEFSTQGLLKIWVTPPAPSVGRDDVERAPANVGGRHRPQEAGEI